MKRIFTFVLLLFFADVVQAQDSTLKEYVGKYIFPEGSVVTSAEITLQDSLLTVNSSHGASELKKMGRDTFMLVSFNGMAYFNRNAAGRVQGIRVEVGDVLLEGVKETASAFFPSRQTANRLRNVTAK